MAEAKLAAMLRSARDAWPDVALSDEAFIDHLARHVTDDAAVAGLHATDLFLAAAICRHDRAALAHFERRFMSEVQTYVLRVRMPPDAVDEVKQKLRESLLLAREGRPPKLAEYSGKGALGGWLRITAVRTALNHVRGANESGATSDGGEQDEPVAVHGDPELAYVRAHTRDVFNDAFKKVLTDLDPTARTILRLHYVEGTTMDQLAKLYQTPRSTIARRVREARQQILEATEKLLQDERHFSPSTVASILRSGRSELDVTLSRLLT